MGNHGRMRGQPSPGCQQAIGGKDFPDIVRHRIPAHQNQGISSTVKTTLPAIAPPLTPMP